MFAHKWASTLGTRRMWTLRSIRGKTSGNNWRECDWRRSMTTKMRIASDYSLPLRSMQWGLRVLYEGKRITDGCVTEDVAGSRRCGLTWITLCRCVPCSGGLWVPSEGNRITDGCMTEDLAGALCCGSPGIALCDCVPCSGSIGIPFREKRPGITGRSVTEDGTGPLNCEWCGSHRIVLCGCNPSCDGLGVPHEERSSGIRDLRVSVDNS